MRTPTLQGILALGQKLMTLIYGGDARDRSGLVVEYLVSYMGRDAKPSHA